MSELDNVGTVHFARFVIVDDNIFVCSPSTTEISRNTSATLSPRSACSTAWWRCQRGRCRLPSCSAGAHGSPSIDDVPAGLREVKPRPAGCRQLEFTVTQPGPAFLDSVPSHFIKL
jgi:hypothetical protein